jgi:hypothetical protein
MRATSKLQEREFTVVLPRPHDKQREIATTNAKRVVINAGRRAGKTTLAARVSVKRFLDGRRILLASTTQNQADAFWDKCKLWLGGLIDAGVIEKNEQKRTLLLGKGHIKVKTAWDADTLRGDSCDFLVLDECALLASDAWDKVGAPMLLDNDGDAWFISSPRRRNWFYHLYQRAVADSSGRWEAYHFTSHDNPHLSPEALTEIAGDLSTEGYRQEILAEFLEGEGSVFRNIQASIGSRGEAEPGEHWGHRVVMGVDWAQKHDYTALSVVCADCRRELALDRFNQIDWRLQRARLDALAKRYRVGHIEAEENSIGSPNIEALRAEGLPVQAFTTTAASKPPLIQNLALAFERGECLWLDIGAATAELEAYESKVSANTGRVSYGAPEGLLDDTVIARALAWRAVTSLRVWQVSGMNE